MTRTADIRMIDDDASLARLCDELRRAGSFAFDTEFVGEDQFEAQVCLIQATSNGQCVLVDPLNGLDLTPFWNIVADPAVEKIVHAGSEDAGLCRQSIDRPVAGFFDLQIAAGFVGFGYPISLLRLAKDSIGLRIHKSQTLTDWRRRPLSAEQVRYAAEDVLHLPQIAGVIRSKLESTGRLEWAMQACREYYAPLTEAAEDVRRLRRLKGSGALSPKELAIADALIDEREKLAQEYNRPPRAVLKDHLLVEIARRGWSDPEKMRELRGLNLNRPAVTRLCHAVTAAKALPPDAWPKETADDADTPEEDVLCSLISTILRDYCNQSGLAYGLVAGKQEVRQFVRSYTRPADIKGPLSLTNGWRAGAIGATLREMMAGSLSIRVEPGKKHRRLRIEPSPSKNG